MAFYGGPQPPAYGGIGAPVAPNFPNRPTVGSCVDQINALSQAERQQLFELLQVIPRDQALATPTPPGMTRDPATGRVYRVTPSREHTDARERLEAAQREAAAALKQHTTNNGGVVSRGDNNNVVVTWPRDTAQAVLDENARLSGILNARRRELAAYKAQHPAEFAPPPVRGGRGRGRGAARGR